MPEVFPLLRVLADRPRTPARFLVLGSASPELLRQPSETLAGRVAYHELGGFGLQEVGDPERLWLRGGLPLSYLARSAPASRRWRDGFIRTFLTRDVPELGSSIPSPTLRRFWTMLAHWHGQTWNGAEFGRAFGVAHTTVRRYLDLLTSVFVVRQLQPWYEDIRKRQVRSPKVYIADSGILHALLGLSTREAVGAQGVFADANARRPRTFRVGHADVGGIRLTVLGYPQRAGKIGELQVGSRRRDLVPSHHARIEVRHLPDGGNPPQLHEPVRGAGKPEPAGLSVAGALAGHLCSHFIDIGSERVLVLGCHDLLLFSGRGRPSANGTHAKGDPPRAHGYTRRQVQADGDPASSSVGFSAHTKLRGRPISANSEAIRAGGSIEVAGRYRNRRRCSLGAAGRGGALTAAFRRAVREYIRYTPQMKPYH